MRLRSNRWRAGTASLTSSAVLAAAHGLLLWLTLSRHLDFLWNDARHRLGPGTDFFAFYSAGLHLLQGQGAYGHGPGFGFRYHPLMAALVGVTLSPLPRGVAYALYVVILEGCFFYVFWRLGAFVKTPRSLLAARVILVFFTPYYLEVYMGNFSFVAAVILLAAFRHLQTDRKVAAFGLLAASIIVKPVGLVFLPYLFVRKHYRAVAILVVGIVLAAVPFFRLDPGSFRSFVQINLSAVPAAGWVVHGGNQGLHGLLTGLCTRASGIATAELSTFAQLPDPCRWMLLALPVALVAVSGAVSWKKRANLPLALFLWSAVYLLGYKDVWEHSYSFSVFCFIWLYAANVLSPKLVMTFAILAALPTAFALYDVPLPPGPFDPEHHWSAPVAFLHHATRSVPFLICYVLVVVACLRNGRRDGLTNLRTTA